DAEHVEGEFFFIHQLRPGHAHKFDADTHEAYVVDVRSDVRTRPGKAHPTTKRLRFDVNAMPKSRRKIVVNHEFASHNTLCFGVAATLESARLPESSHLSGKAFDH